MSQDAPAGPESATPQIFGAEIRSARLSRRRFGALAATSFAVFGTGTAACSKSSGGGATTLDTTAPVKLELWTGQTADTETILENLARSFEKLHTNVSIDVSAGASTTDDLLQKLSAGFAGGDYPDMSYAYGSWASELADSGKTLDIAAEVADPAVKWSQLPEPGRLTATPDGKKTIGFPAIVDNLALFYNTTLFDAAGVAHPTNEWTWDDFRAAARKLTDPSRELFGYCYSVSGSEDTTWHLWPLLWQQGGEILSPDNTKSAFNSEAGVAALTLLQDMAVTDKSVYLDQTDEKYPALFASNRVAMMISGPWEFYDLAQAKTKYGVTYLPAFGGDHQTVAGPDIWALFDHSDANRAHWAFEFARWLTDPAQDEIFNVAEGNLPLRAAEEQSAGYKKIAAATPGLQTVVDNFANAKKARPTVSGYVGLSAAVGQAIAAVMQGAAQPKAALDAAAKKADKALAEAQ